MKKATLGLFILGAFACSAPDGSMHTVRDVPDEPAGNAAVADRMRELEKDVYKVTVDDLPAIGSPTAPLTIVVFGDYECPFCSKAEAQIAQLRAEHGAEVRVVLAPKPLAFHKQAKPAALAAIAAAEQGKLEPMHRALIALDNKIDEAAIESAAREAGLDLARFHADRKSAKAEATLVKADELAKRFSVKATPTVFVNGRRITGAVPDAIHQLGEDQLRVARGLVKDGTPPARVYDTIIGEGRESAGPDPSIATFRLQGDDAEDGKEHTTRLVELAKCWESPGAKPPRDVELLVASDGTVKRATTSNPEHAACITRVTASWTFPKREGGFTVKLLHD